MSDRDNRKSEDRMKENTPHPEENFWLASVFEELYPRLLNLAKFHINPALLRRITPEDVVQELFLIAARRVDDLKKNEDVPVFVKLRTLLLQTHVDLERKYLFSQKRNPGREANISSSSNETGDGGSFWNKIMDGGTSPTGKLTKMERKAILLDELSRLSETDREILNLRHFEELSNQECAAVLKIEPKAASIRYFRALKRLRDKLTEYTDFK